MIIMRGIMNYEHIALFLKQMWAGMINCESTWPGLSVVLSYEVVFRKEQSTGHT